MLGTIVNCVVVLLCGFIGFFVKKAIPETIQKPIMQMIGLSVTLIGLIGFLGTVLVVDGFKIKTSQELLLLISLVLGIIIGEMLKIDTKINAFGEFIEKKANIDGFAKGFVTSSILFCVGAMAILGSLKDGISGDSSILFLKSTIDGITSIILGSSLGIGVAFSAVTIFLYQGSISLMASFLSPFISDSLLSAVCMVGYVIVICIGTNILGITKIKTANMLPALLIPILYFVGLKFI